MEYETDKLWNFVYVKVNIILCKYEESNMYN